MDREALARVFNEWARRYAENPSEFDSILDADGKPIKDYGERCVRTLERYSKEMGVDLGISPEKS